MNLEETKKIIDKLDVNKLQNSESMLEIISANQLDVLKIVINKIQESKLFYDKELLEFKKSLGKILSKTIESDNIEAAKCLIKAGANLNVPDENELLPLHYAITKNLPVLCNLLIEKGADQDWEKGVSVTPRFMGQISENSIIN